ncbi:MAG: hypothetical protein A3C22_01535 [Candidatus Levybacteria bacterium RIFCSPHIGHO2_02_FULL_37_10]|nr:MAG: hypothetical protein A3C22_01535 [Candidatus Levybacteria bacterium RIFCSPHIGHO2_02_FULL_37_10]OGH41749.1 MAG: hypothetical protein A3H79_01210 [Candidatus Levybacteria bacterium RIFCSPLOWO2_02_FULL_36_8b]
MKIKSLFNKFSSKGFTLIELLVVIAIVGILAAAVLTAINPLKRIQQANDAGLKSDIGQIAQAMQTYYTSSSTTAAPFYPRAVSDLVTSGDLKNEPKIPPAKTVSYNVTGSTSVPDTACTTAGANCVNVTVYAQLNETGVGYWCWASATGASKISASAPAVTGTVCP